jgi:hypothetical protein
MKGGQALFNAHEFAKGNIFGMREGVMAELDGNKVFLFAYEDESEATEWLGKAWKALASEDGYQDATSREGEFSAVDGEGSELKATVTGRFILLAVGESPAAKLQMLRDRISGT